ncbi:hypothetical protein [Demequina soli]|uniref:hypothetical protein n=1 Tax=Demequina soli TaxID=1638987 RepID=UPI000781D095|nr:hypothetical protein [Demequina soli]
MKRPTRIVTTAVALAAPLGIVMTTAASAETRRHDVVIVCDAPGGGYLQYRASIEADEATGDRLASDGCYAVPAPVSSQAVTPSQATPDQLPTPEVLPQGTPVPLAVPQATPQATPDQYPIPTPVPQATPPGIPSPLAASATTSVRGGGTDRSPVTGAPTTAGEPTTTTTGSPSDTVSPDVTTTARTRVTTTAPTTAGAAAPVVADPGAQGGYTG